MNKRKMMEIKEDTHQKLKVFSVIKKLTMSQGIDYLLDVYNNKAQATPEGMVEIYDEVTGLTILKEVEEDIDPNQLKLEVE